MDSKRLSSPLVVLLLGSSFLNKEDSATGLGNAPFPSAHLKLSFRVVEELVDDLDGNICTPLDPLFSPDKRLAREGFAASKDAGGEANEKEGGVGVGVAPVDRPARASLYLASHLS